MRLIPIQERLDSGADSTAPRAPSSLPAESTYDTAGPASPNGKYRARVAGIFRPRGIAQVPTHTVGRARERRAYVRAHLALPLCVRTIAGRHETSLGTLLTQDISSSGIFFLCPRRLDPGTPIEMEVTLVDKPVGRGTVRMRTQACVVRVEKAQTPGWHGLAAAFDDITFIRDESVPSA